jgi:hypothetical protein
MTMELESKSVKELRELAKQQGLANYSKLTKEELIRLLAAKKRGGASKPATGNKTTAAGKKPAAKKGSATRKTAANGRPAAGKAPKAERPAPPADLEPGLRADATETQVEEAKYVLTPPGIPEFVHREPADLGEDIDALPPIPEPLLCLLPQKPGVLHAYWVVDPPMLERKEGLRLRLTRLGESGQGVELLQEFEVNAASGHWYLHLPETEDPGDVFLQLGHYTSAGEFVSPLHRGTVRVPSLRAAAGKVDARWWFSDEQFREMYLRAGGYLRGTRLGWAGPAASSR